MQLGVDNVSELIKPLNKQAQVWAEEHAGELITGLEETTRDEIGDYLADSFREGVSREEIADALSDIYGFSDDRAKLIAVTEAQRANGAGSVEGLRQAAKNGLAVKKEWICDPDPCPVCEENQDAGAIDVNELFPSGDDGEPQHPNCMCFVQGVVESDKNEDSDED